MATSPAQSSLGLSRIARVVAVCVLAVVGLTALTGFMVVHWTEKQVLTTDNWVQTVGPLPKNDQVSTALSTYAVDQLFTTTDLQNRIAQALPDKAAFLAPPLADQLQTRLTNRTKQVIQSDKFESIWQTANRAASTRLLEGARNPEQAGTKAPARFNVDLSSLKSTVTNILNERGITQPSDSTKDVGVAVNLKTSVEKVHTYIRVADFLNATLWLLALVCLLGAVALSRTRRHLIMLLAAAVVVIALLQIIGVKAVRPFLLNEIGDASFRPAVGVVYDTLITSFRDSAVTVLIGGVVAFVLAFVLHQPLLTRSKAIASWLNSAQKSTVGKYWISFRAAVGRYCYHAMAAAVVLGLGAMAFAIDIDWHSGVRSVLFILLTIEIISLVAVRPPKVPMKQ